MSSGSSTLARAAAKRSASSGLASDPNIRRMTMATCCARASDRTTTPALAPKRGDTLLQERARLRLRLRRPGWIVVVFENSAALAVSAATSASSSPSKSAKSPRKASMSRGQALEAALPSKTVPRTCSAARGSQWKRRPSRSLAWPTRPMPFKPPLPASAGNFGAGAGGFPFLPPPFALWAASSVDGALPANAVLGVVGLLGVGALPLPFPLPLPLPQVSPAVVSLLTSGAEAAALELPWAPPAAPPLAVPPGEATAVGGAATFPALAAAPLANEIGVWLGDGEVRPPAAPSPTSEARRRDRRGE
mmetsp:Transcript_97636/g.280959  ORF Transcript_97636/g.280959 Transcript_97636/m.280959 type:complete len:305 (+) Transcript_97636:1035-1949(+)